MSYVGRRGRNCKYYNLSIEDVEMEALTKLLLDLVLIGEAK